MIGTVISGTDRDVIDQRNPEATLYVSKLAPEVDEELLWELFTQVGPVASVFMPKEAKSTQHKVRAGGVLGFLGGWRGGWGGRVACGRGVGVDLLERCTVRCGGRALP
jgi:hypothetical protein